MRNEQTIYSAAVYCRLSKDDEQAGESVSIETQKMMLTDFCHERGFSIYEIYADDGYSGLNFNRPAFTRLLEDIDSGKINYERVQSLISQRHRPKKHNFDNVFKDLTFCAECGHRMTLMMKPLKAGPTPLIRYTHHYTNPEDCKHNYTIYYDDLYGEVLKRIRGIASKIESGELLERIQKQSTKRVKTDKLIAEQTKANKRLTVLKRIIKKLYEDFAADLLDSESYHSMLTEYTNEQKQITARLAVIEAELGTEGNDEQNVQKLKAVLDEYLNILVVKRC